MLSLLSTVPQFGAPFSARIQLNFHIQQYFKVQLLKLNFSPFQQLQFNLVSAEFQLNFFVWDVMNTW